MQRSHGLFLVIKIRTELEIFLQSERRSFSIRFREETRGGKKNRLRKPGIPGILRGQNLYIEKGRCPRLFDSVFIHPALQGSPADTQGLGSVAHVPLIEVEGFDDHALFKMGQIIGNRHRKA